MRVHISQYSLAYVSSNAAHDGTFRAITVQTKDQPTEVKLWQATNAKARDFRLDTIGAAYKSTPLAAEKAGVYRAQVAPPAEGYTAYFVELTFASGGKYPFKFTTGVRVTPDKLPFSLPKRDTVGR